MSERTVTCSLCWGSGKYSYATLGEEGRCPDCAGIGTFTYGENRDPEAVQVELIQVRGILRESCLELDRWEWTKERPEELIDVDGKVVPGRLKDAVDYWKYQVERLEKELAEYRPKTTEGQSDGERTDGTEHSSRPEQRSFLPERTGRRVAGPRKSKVR